MKNLIRLMIGVLAWSSTTVFALEPTNELSVKEAVRLITMKSNAPANTIEIAFIVDGSAKCEGFEVKNVRRVAAIHGVQEGGKQSRKLVFYDLFWNEALGWFMWESRNERTGEAVYLWSELRGEIVNR
ncbi:MAG: hypothetical protein H8M99_04055 [Gloeobacteraceae cyanobacterium ES-bin-144]|nr:hypothetical protein [Verrucomicrobiales bacterium]